MLAEVSSARIDVQKDITKTIELVNPVSTHCHFTVKPLYGFAWTETANISDSSVIYQS